MKMLFSLLASLTVFETGANAFPHFARAGKQSLNTLQETQASPVTPVFNAAQQLVSTTGDHAFTAPKDGDLRGPCPGLNALANHGYIPRNGVASIAQFSQATQDVFGMGADLANVLATIGAVVDGNLVSFSIGGTPPSDLLTSLTGAGASTGLTNAHNKYEGDASPTRGDLFQYKNDDKVVLSQFRDLFTSPLGPRGYDLSVLIPFRSRRFQQSIDNNPYFFNGPFTGIAVQAGAYSFIYRFMSNKSAEYPDGYLSPAVLKSFFAITGSAADGSDLVYTPGSERIPDNWYKRAIGDEYTIPAFVADLAAMAATNPRFLSVGGNTGTVKSFAGVDLSNLTGGVYNATSLADGKKALCFALQAAQQGAPDLLTGVVGNIAGALGILGGALGSVVSGLACPELKAYDSTQLGIFPGSKGSL